MLNDNSRKIIIDKIRFLEENNQAIENLSNDKHFLSELSILLMLLETEGKNNSDTYPLIYNQVKQFVHNYIFADEY